MSDCHLDFLVITVVGRVAKVCIFVPDVGFASDQECTAQMLVRCRSVQTLSFTVVAIHVVYFRRRGRRRRRWSR